LLYVIVVLFIPLYIAVGLGVGAKHAYECLVEGIDAVRRN
jgi:hypothetical protein